LYPPIGWAPGDDVVVRSTTVTANGAAGEPGSASTTALTAVATASFSLWFTASVVLGGDGKGGTGGVGGGGGMRVSPAAARSDSGPATLQAVDAESSN
jgi:hypothetical protein